MSNRLLNESSPYLLQHANNPVDWYPWGEEAFQKAKREDKPIFLSIGYSTCHWCHVMAHESFEDAGVAGLLNDYFVSIKVDREERPDIDGIYMAVCEAFTGSGGWPMTIFMSPEQKPFFAGTYFPRESNGGMPGLKELLLLVHEDWEENREALLEQSDEILSALSGRSLSAGTAGSETPGNAIRSFKRYFDQKNGGFGRAPKFPTPHNLLFLLEYYERYRDEDCLSMTEKTLVQMYRGGLFDHIGYGFCRYSTDDRFLVPHFEKMLYDNALLILAYCKAYSLTKKNIYIDIARKTASFVLSEMTSPEGGFYSALDADSEGAEGQYYLFEPGEILSLLGEEEGTAFNLHFGITEGGNFDGKSIPNLLDSPTPDLSLDRLLPIVREYRKKRFSIHLDDKILTFWNALMIAAMSELFFVSRNDQYLTAAKRADAFLRENLRDGDSLFVSIRNGKRGVKGFLDDYAGLIRAKLSLYKATLDETYLREAEELCEYVNKHFSDEKNGGYYFYSADSETLILRPKDSQSGALPGGNSIMAWNLVRISQLTNDEKYETRAISQLNFLSGEAEKNPMFYATFLSALLEYYEPKDKITVVLSEDDALENLSLPEDSMIVLLKHPTKEYPLKNNKTTYYVCKNHSCFPPVNTL